MSTYAIGDVHGCLQPLLDLLAKINYHPQKDVLWFTGDLVNRGPQSLETLDYVMRLPSSTKVVLGNHDLSLLVTYAGFRQSKSTDTFDDILHSPNVDKYIHWLRQLPLCYHDNTLGYTLAHAGIYPLWDITLALALSNEIQEHLQSDHYKDFLAHLFGNEPTEWNHDLQDWDRARFIVNAFTRMRYCKKTGALDWSDNNADSQGEVLPWFDVAERKTTNDKILFGHWAALQGNCDTPNVFALDTGCVWGHHLTALCLETKERFSISTGSV